MLFCWTVGHQKQDEDFKKIFFDHSFPVQQIFPVQQTDQ
jgi:hypothetical protein